MHYQKSECETTRNVSIQDSEVATQQDGNCKQQQVATLNFTSATLPPHPTSESEIPQPHREEMVLESKSICQQRIPLVPIVDPDLFAQQHILKHGWVLDRKIKWKAFLRIICKGGKHLVDGHPIAKCILNKFQSSGKFYRGDFIGQRKERLLIVNARKCTTPHRMLLPSSIDGSISKLEEAFANQFQTKRVIYIKDHSSGEDFDITIPILAAMLYRSAYGVSISLEHFVNSTCCHCTPYSREVQQTVIKLREVHDDICRKLLSKHKSMEDIVSVCKHLNIVHAWHPKREGQLIEYPHFVKVHVPHYGLVSCIYMQIPPFSFAIPMFDSNGKSNDGNYNQLRQHFPRVVHEIQKGA